MAGKLFHVWVKGKSKAGAPDHGMVVHYAIRAETGRDATSKGEKVALGRHLSKILDSGSMLIDGEDCALITMHTVPLFLGE